jgi:hypothetical protein
MEKVEVLKKFLNKGLQLDFESLEFFSKSPDEIEQFFQKISTENRPTTVTMSFINEVVNKHGEGLRILKTPKQVKNTLSVDDISQILNKRYNFLKKILSARIDLVNLISINKITPKVKRFSAIILIKEKFDDEKAVFGEDDTGEYKFFLKHDYDFEQILQDDVIGIICENDERVKVEKIIWPDIPMKREINKTKEDFFVSISNYKETVNEPAEDRNEIKQKILLEGGHIKISSDTFDFPLTAEINQGVVFLFMDSCFLKKYSEFEKDELIFIISLLKRRNLDPTFQFNQAIFVNDPFIVDTIPDIFVIFGSMKSTNTNYKGTTIITIPHLETEKAAWMVNLKTRVVKKL